MPLDGFSGAKSYIEARSGASADQYKSPDGKFYQIPWKQNPVMIFYNKDLFKKAGLDPNNPKLSTYDDFLATSKKIVDSKAAPSAIAPAPRAKNATGALAASAAGVPRVTITSTSRRASSPASSPNVSFRPAAERYSNVRFCPSA